MSADPRNIAVSRNSRLLEFAVVITIFCVTIWLIAPGIDDGIKMGHETTVKHSASALRDSVQWLQLQKRSHTGQPNQASELHRDVHNKPLSLTREVCQTLWYSWLGAAAPKASIHGNAVFRIQLIHNGNDGLGCRYRYALAGNMFIDYFPKSDRIEIDDRF